MATAPASGRGGPILDHATRCRKPALSRWGLRLMESGDAAARRYNRVSIVGGVMKVGAFRALGANNVGLAVEQVRPHRWHGHGKGWRIRVAP